MATIVIAHGMRMQHYSKAALQAKWSAALRAGLKGTEWGRANPGRVPRAQDIEVVYWADLFKKRPPALEPVTKGVASALLAPYFGLWRGAVRLADHLSFWDGEGAPRGPVAHAVNPIVHQSAIYMRNGPVTRPDPSLDPGAFFQVQARFRAALKADTRVVIGHSLGSVVAYEGLCLYPHAVDSFITVGSPIATRRLILQPLRERLNRLIGAPLDGPLPWPGVERWANFYASGDVWSVPVKRLAPVFDRRIVDVEVKHGNPHRAVATHKLTTYFRQPALLAEIARGLELSPQQHVLRALA